MKKLQIDFPSTAFQKVIVPSSLPEMISALLEAQQTDLTFYFPLRVAFILAYFSRPGLSRSNTFNSPSS